MKIDDTILSSCLFHTASLVSRQMTKMAETIFKDEDISPSYLYLLVVVQENPGINQKELSSKLGIAPSTCTRFVDKLVKKGILSIKSEWKETKLFLTDYGHELMAQLTPKFEKLFITYSSILGAERSAKLAADLHEASEILKKESL